MTKEDIRTLLLAILGTAIYSGGMWIISSFVGILLNLSTQEIWLLVLTILVLTNIVITLLWNQRILKGRLIIYSAKYGVESLNTGDVTQIVIGQISPEGRLDMIVHNKLLDPDDVILPGTPKELQVVYSTAREKTVPEGKKLTLP